MIRKIFLLFSLTTLLISTSIVRAQDDSVESLYKKAIEFSTVGDNLNASKTFEKLFELAKPDALLKDYGAQTGGIFFDYAMTLMPQKRWADAKVWFTKCITAREDAKNSSVKSINQREKLAKSKLELVEAKMGSGTPSNPGSRQ